MDTTAATTDTRCETFSLAGGHCPNEATMIVVHKHAGIEALACSEHAAVWTRVRKVRGQLVPVHPGITAEPIF